MRHDNRIRVTTYEPTDFPRWLNVALEAFVVLVTLGTLGVLAVAVFR